METAVAAITSFLFKKDFIGDSFVIAGDGFPLKRSVLSPG
jgi:hypothetical protein